MRIGNCILAVLLAVPLGSHAVDAITRWLPDRLALRKTGRDPGAVFLNARGGRLSRQELAAEPSPALLLLTAPTAPDTS